MKLQTLRRGTAAAAVLTLSMGLAACGGDDEGSDAGTDDSSSAAVESEEAPSEDAPTEEAPDADPAAQVFGDACGEVPTDGEGSLTGMVDDPVATAASNNPLLGQLVGAVGAAGLVDTLNTVEAATVFAPYDPAFAELGDAATALVEEATAAEDPTTTPLAQVLTHHVIAGQLDPTAVVGEQETLNGDTLTISGDPETGMTVSDGVVDATVLCGNIPTANATVYVIDKVLAGPVS